MATISASVYTSHVPAIGAAMDLGKTQEPYWRKVFSGYEASRRWLADPTRFRRSASAGAYLGLTPKMYESGETKKVGRISRRGDALSIR